MEYFKHLGQVPFHFTAKATEVGAVNEHITPTVE
jgi:hypothetical protein